MPAKTSKQTKDQLRKHVDCDIKVDWSCEEAGIWCRTHWEPIGTYYTIK